MPSLDRPANPTVWRWTSSLALKLVLCLIGGMIAIFTILGLQNTELHRRDLEALRLASADSIGDVIKRSTRLGMLRNQRDDIYEMIKTIGAGAGINKIRIFNKEGRISFSTDEREVGGYVDKSAESCTKCHAREQPIARLDRLDRARTYVGPAGERILGVISPVENEASCTGSPCHYHPPEKQVLGVLDVTMSLAGMDAMIAQGQEQLVLNLLSAAVIIAGLAGALVWWMVYRPVRRLHEGMGRVAGGDLEHKIPVVARDELSQLAICFNGMTGELKKANEGLTDWARTLESRVEEEARKLAVAHEQMIQVERMASMGKLAAIVAHEINNPLAGILTSARFLLKRLGKGSPAPGSPGIEDWQEHLEMVAAESGRCGEIVKNLLQFTRQSKGNLLPSDVKSLVTESLRLVRHKLDLMSVDLTVELPEDVPPIICDPQEIKQALIAILINACEALPRGEGKLTVGVRHLTDPRAVEIFVADNGVGMDEETRKHIFEPFFTTKEGGRSVGLGLSVVNGIVTRHGGRVEVDSAPGRGTTLAIRLPLSVNGQGV